MNKLDIYFTIIDIFKNLDDIAPLIRRPYACEAFKTLCNPFFQNRFMYFVSQRNVKNTRKIYSEVEELIDYLNSDDLHEMQKMGLAYQFINKYSKYI